MPTYASSSNVRCLWGFAAEVFVIAFGGLFSVGNMPFVEIFAFIGGCSTSLQLEIMRSIDSSLASFPFCTVTFAFSRGFASLFPFCFISFWRTAINAFASLLLETTGEGVHRALEIFSLTKSRSIVRERGITCGSSSCLNTSTQSASTLPLPKSAGSHASAALVEPVS